LNRYRFNIWFELLLRFCDSCALCGKNGVSMNERDPQTGLILAAAVEVHKTLGHGFLETVYQFALAHEFDARDIPFVAQMPMPVFYKGERLKCGFRADFLCFGSVLVEIKAQAGLTDVDEAQVINYLRASELQRALLLNFGCSTIQIKRIILTAAYRHRDIEEAEMLVE
jgi:GxxExxY protein